MTKLAVSIIGPDIAAISSQMATVMPYADLIEWRIDLFDERAKEGLLDLRKNLKVPLILTVKKESDRSYTKVLQPEYIDVENKAWIDRSRQTILSKHVFSGEWNLEELYEELRRTPADIYKIAVKAKDGVDALEVLEFAKRANVNSKSLICIAMGEDGTPSRILAPFTNAPWTYASAATNLEAAPGQIPAQELTERYGFKEGIKTIYGLIGDPVVQSVSHRSHNRVMRHLSLDAVYTKFRVPIERLGGFYQLAKELPIKGLSVTMPLKEHVMPPNVINTLVLTEPLQGYNTDGVGALQAIGDVRGKNIFISGAGGTAKAISIQAIANGAHVTLFNRTVRPGVLPLDELHFNGCDIFINTIPNNDRQHLFNKSMTVMDCAYGPFSKSIIEQAQSKGCRVIEGLELFIKQALEQFKIWFVGKLDPKVVEEIIRDEVYQNTAK